MNPPAPLPPDIAGANHPWLAELRETSRLAVPMVALQLGQIAINTTDVLMIGRLGPDALAAGALGSHFFMAVWLFCLGVLQAVAPLAAQARGARSPRGVRRTVRQGFWVAAAVALPASLLLWHTEAVLRLLGQAPANATAAGGYVQAMLWGFLPSMGFVVLRGFLAALSRPLAPMIAVFAGVLLNVVLDYGLIFGELGLPRLGLVGAGVASALVHLATFAGLLAWTLAAPRLRRYHLLVRFWRPDWPRFLEIFRIGLPIGATLLAEAGLFTMTTMMMGWIGTATLAAHAIALQWTAVTFMVPLGIGQAVTVRVGLAYGRGDAEGVRRAGWTALSLGSAAMVATAGLYLALPETLIALFLDLEEPGTLQVLALGSEFLLVAAIFQLADGAQVVGGCALRGLSDTRVPMWLAMFGYWGVGLGLGWLLAFPLGLGGMGIWYGLAAGLGVAALSVVLRFSLRVRFGLMQPARA